jgi:hypothetical protein
VPARKKPSVGTGRFVFCPYSNQGPQSHGMFAIEVMKKEETGNLWTRCVCGVRIQIDHGRLPAMTKQTAHKAGAIFPFMG